MSYINQLIDEFKADKEYREAMTQQIIRKLENETGLYQIEKDILIEALKEAGKQWSSSKE